MDEKTSQELEAASDRSALGLRFDVTSGMRFFGLQLGVRTTLSRKFICIWQTVTGDFRPTIGAGAIPSERGASKRRPEFTWISGVVFRRAPPPPWQCRFLPGLRLHAPSDSAAVHLTLTAQHDSRLRGDLCKLTRGWSGPARDQLVTSGRRWAPAAQPQVVRWQSQSAAVRLPGPLYILEHVRGAETAPVGA